MLVLVLVLTLSFSRSLVLSLAHFSRTLTLTRVLFLVLSLTRFSLALVPTHVCARSRSFSLAGNVPNYVRARGALIPAVPQWRGGIIAWLR